MSNMKFIVYCMEIYREAKNLTGKDVYNKFTESGVIEFIDEFYDVLHSTSNKDIIWQIDDYLQHQLEKSSSISEISSKVCTVMPCVNISLSSFRSDS